MSSIDTMRPAGARRLLFIVPWMRLGGADRYNLLLIRELTRRGFAVTVCATIAGEHSWQVEFKRSGAEVLVLPSLAGPDDYPVYIAQLMAARQIEIVLLSHSMLGYALLPYLRSVCPRAVYVDYNHMVATAWHGGGYARMAVNYQKYLDLNIVSSKQVKQWMLTQGAEAQRVAVSYTNIDADDWDPGHFDRAALRRALNVPADLPVIIFPARLEPQKRPRVLANILLSLKRRGCRFLCLVAGDGAQFRWLAGYVVRHQLQDSVWLLGPVEPQRLTELMAISDVLLLPSRDEGIAVSLFEAMSMGVVPVSADVGGQRELVTPETGFLLPHGWGELPAYVRVLATLLEAPARRARLGQASRERVQREFNVGQMAERMVQLLEQARELASQQPRALVATAEGEMSARLAIENLRWDRMQEMLRLDQPPMLAGHEPFTMRAWRQFVFKLKQHVLRPLYGWGLSQGFEWLEPLANDVYRLFSGVLR